MEQRPLRLGDIVDDYCPRERRITNHAVVAIVEDAIRQTRCTTCEAEHVYKDGREPRRRRKEPEPALVSAAPEPASPAVPAPRHASMAEGDSQNGQPRVMSEAASAPPGDAADTETETDGPGAAPDDGWPAHRQLIRATLPRTEGEPPTPRPIPEFTMHQRQGRGGHGFRYAQGWNGNGPDRGNGFRPDRSANGTGRAPVNGNTQGGQGHGQNRPAGSGRRRRGRHKPPPPR